MRVPILVTLLLFAGGQGCVDEPRCEDDRHTFATCPQQTQPLEPIRSSGSWVLPLPLCTRSWVWCAPDGGRVLLGGYELDRPNEALALCNASGGHVPDGRYPVCLHREDDSVPPCVSMPCDGVGYEVERDGRSPFGDIPTPSCSPGEAVPRCGTAPSLSSIGPDENFMWRFVDGGLDPHAVATCGSGTVPSCAELAIRSDLLATCVDGELVCANGASPWCVVVDCSASTVTL